MSTTPTLLSVSPLDQATDVVLGCDINLTFNTPINQATVTVDTFLLQGPGQTTMVGPTQLISLNPTSVVGREYITGSFNWDSTSTILTFIPDRPLQPNTTYSIMIVGQGGGLSKNYVESTDGTSLDKTYQWSFTTGDLNVSKPPVQCPLPPLRRAINPADIIVKIAPRLKPVGNDLSQEIDFIFPAPIDSTTFNPTSLQASIDPILNDIYVRVPDGLVTTATLSTDLTTIKVVITGWPPDWEDGWRSY